MSDFGRDLIIAEERRREEGEEVPTASTEVIVIQREDVTESSPFVFNEPGTTMPIEGPGTLVEAVLAADSEAFSISVTLDGREVVSNDYKTLRNRATELERISAYERQSDGDFVFIASDYEFQHSIEVAVVPDDTLTVRLQRAEVDVVR